LPCFLKKENADSSFAFINHVENEKTKEKIKLLKTIIEEILILEEYACSNVTEVGD
jgi:hypothetical protein